MIKYFCDLCNKEVDSLTKLSTIELESIDADLAREFNRYDYNKWQPGFKHKVCVECRVEIHQFIKKMIDNSKVTEFKA